MNPFVSLSLSLSLLGQRGTLSRSSESWSSETHCSADGYIREQNACIDCALRVSLLGLSMFRIVVQGDI